MPLFHENRVVGKAIYAFDTERFDVDQSVKSGLNTLAIRPFDLLITSD